MSSGDERGPLLNNRRPESSPGEEEGLLRSDIDSDDSDHEPTSREEEEAGDEAASSRRRTSRRQGRDQMLFIVLLALLLVAIVIVFALSLAQIIVLGDSQSLAQEVLSACMIVGIVVILFLYVKNDTAVRPRRPPVHLSVRDQLKYILRHFLSIVGMSFFYPFSCILDLFHVVTAASCDSVWRECGGRMYEQHIADVLFHLLRILFMGAELLFCLRFHSAQFTRYNSVRCCLMVVMAVNIGLWFITLLHEVADRDEEPSCRFAVNTINDTLVELLTECRGNVTDFRHALKCLDQSTPEFGHLGHVKPYLIPFALEFSILVGEFLAAKFFRRRRRRRRRSQANGPLPRQEDLATASATGHSSNLVSTLSEASTADGSSRSRPFRWPFILVLAVGILANVVCVTLAFYTTPMAADVHSETSVVRGRGVFKRYLILYWVLTTALIGLGFGCGGSTRVHPKKMRGIDYLVLTSAFGPLIEGSVGSIAVYRNSANINVHINWMVLLASELTNLLQYVVQVPFIFYSDRVRFSEDERGSVREGTFKAVVLSMAICNITQWILNSVLLAGNSMMFRLLQPSIGQQGTWCFLDGILSPLGIFFRFSSFLLFLRAYLGG